VIQDKNRFILPPLASRGKKKKEKEKKEENVWKNKFSSQHKRENALLDRL
jgi:hypothetical protein